MLLMDINNELSSQQRSSTSSSSPGASDANLSSLGRQRMDNGQLVYVTACSTKMETVLFMHKWSISQFSVQQELSSPGDFLESNTFGSTNGDYRFRLKLFPSGKDDECRGYLSLFLQIFRCPSTKLRFRVNFYIEATDGPRGCALNKNVVTINRGGIVTASKFFSLETLKSRVARFLPDDVLTVGVELTVYGEQNSCEIDPEEGECYGSDCVPSFCGTVVTAEDGHKISTGVASIGYDLGTLLDSGDFADFILRVGRKSFKCHKAILSARSQFFQAMFRDQNNQESVSGEATLEGVTPEVIASVLEFIYKDTFMEGAKSLELLAAADRFCLDRMKQRCQEMLVKELDLKNVCELLRAADLYSAQYLKNKAIKLILRNRHLVFVSPEWSEMENDCPALAANVLKEVVTKDIRLEQSSTMNFGHDSVPSKRARFS